MTKEELLSNQKWIMKYITEHKGGETFYHGHPLIVRLDEIEKELARLEFSEFMKDFTAEDWLKIYRGEE